MSEVDWNALRTALRDHPVHGIEPVGSEYAFGRVHKDRASLYGYKQEVRKFVKFCLLRLRGETGSSKKFLIFARPRSGTTLLADLLQQVPDLYCDREVLHFAVSNPLRHLRHLSGSRTTTAYGCKVLSYQLFEVQRMSDPLGFMKSLVETGFQLVHLRRNSFDATLSLARAQQTRHYHSPVGHAENGAGQPPTSIVLDVEKFQRLFQWNAAMLDYECQLLSAFPHLRLKYDDDLKTPEQQQVTVDRICHLLEHPTGPVSARLKPRRSESYNRIENLEALQQSVQHITVAD